MLSTLNRPAIKYATYSKLQLESAPDQKLLNYANFGHTSLKKIGALKYKLSLLFKVTCWKAQQRMPADALLFK